MYAVVVEVAGEAVVSRDGLACLFVSGQLRVTAPQGAEIVRDREGDKKRFVDPFYGESEWTNVARRRAVLVSRH